MTPTRFVYDGEGGVEWFRTKAAAQKYFQDTISQYRNWAENDGEWDPDVERIRMGIVTHDVILSPIEGDKLGASSWDAMICPDRAATAHLRIDDSNSGGALMTDQLLEDLADLEHRQWAHWTAYMLSLLSPEGTLHPATITRWRRQIQTPYSDLPEAEKESDRKWARQVLAVVTQGGQERDPPRCAP